jgi:hypothetical protein
MSTQGFEGPVSIHPEDAMVCVFVSYPDSVLQRDIVVETEIA